MLNDTISSTVPAAMADLLSSPSDPTASSIFLSPFLSPPPPAYTDLAQLYDAQVQAAWAFGTAQPLILPYHCLPFFGMLLYMILLEPSRSRIVRVVRYAGFAFFFWWGLHCMHTIRSPRPLIAYGMGLVNAWCLAWMAALIVFNDVKDFRRIWAIKDAPPADQDEVRRQVREWEARMEREGKEYGHMKEVAIKDRKGASSELRQRLTEKEKENGHAHGNGHANGHAKPPRASHPDVIKYYWQPIPTSLVARAEWVWDLMSAFRAPGWEHQIRSIPLPPDEVLAGLPEHQLTARPTVSPFTDRGKMLRYNALMFVVTYVGLDVLKWLTTQDPYFWGFLDAELLPKHPLYGIATTPLTLTLYRSTMSLTCIGFALRLIWTLNAFFYGGLFGHGRWPFRLGCHSDAWAFPNLYGSPMYIATHGLAGWWGAWWHQIFRYGFEAPTFWLCRKLGWRQQENRAKILAVLVAFSLSGYIHGAGSYNTWPESRPVSGSFLFFFLQGIGTLIETTVVKMLQKRGVLKRLPTSVKRIATVAWVLVWMFMTGPLLAADFARCGLWLFEPIPFSVLRLFPYFRLPGQDYFTWRGTEIAWHTGKHWWQSGVSI